MCLALVETPLHCAVSCAEGQSDTTLLGGPAVLAAGLLQPPCMCAAGSCLQSTVDMNVLGSALLHKGSLGRPMCTKMYLQVFMCTA